MAKLIKQVRLDSHMIGAITEIADLNHDGNFTAALESLVNQSLVMRGIDINVRYEMYDKVKQAVYKQTEKDTGVANVRQLIDALHI